MADHLTFTIKEHSVIVTCFNQLAEILLNKMDAGVNRPHLKSEIVVKNEDRKVTMSMVAFKIEPAFPTETIKPQQKCQN